MTTYSLESELEPEFEEAGPPYTKIVDLYTNDKFNPELVDQITMSQDTSHMSMAIFEPYLFTSMSDMVSGKYYIVVTDLQSGVVVKHIDMPNKFQAILGMIIRKHHLTYTRAASAYPINSLDGVYLSVATVKFNNLEENGSIDRLGNYEIIVYDLSLSDFTLSEGRDATPEGGLLNPSRIFADFKMTTHVRSTSESALVLQWTADQPLEHENYDPNDITYERVHVIVMLGTSGGKATRVAKILGGRISYEYPRYYGVAGVVWYNNMPYLVHYSKVSVGEDTHKIRFFVQPHGTQSWLDSDKTNVLDVLTTTEYLPGYIYSLGWNVVSMVLHDDKISLMYIPTETDNLQDLNSQISHVRLTYYEGNIAHSSNSVEGMFRHIDLDSSNNISSVTDYYICPSVILKTSDIKALLENPSEPITITIEKVKVSDIDFSKFASFTVSGNTIQAFVGQKELAGF